MNIQKALTISGWMSARELTFLAECASKAGTTVEFGCFLGRSTRAMADNTEGKIYAVDPWDGIYFKDDGSPSSLFHKDDYVQFLCNLNDHIQTGKVIPCIQHSDEFYESKHADFVFLDGDHRYQVVYDDIMRGLYLLGDSKYHMLAGHDYGRADWPGVKQAVDEIFSDKVTILDTIWYVD